MTTTDEDQATKTHAKDANEVLQEWVRRGVGAEEQGRLARTLLAGSRTVVEIVCEAAGELEGAERDRGMQDAMGLVSKMRELERGLYREKLWRLLGLKGVREFENLVGRYQAEQSKTEKEGKGLPVEFNGGVLGEYFCEMVYDPEEGRTRLVVRDGEGRVDEREELVVDGERFVATYPDALITKNAVLLPSRLRPLRSTRELVAIIKSHIHRYLDVDEFYESLCAYYVLFTWLYDCFQLVPYLRALGDYGTGKTRLLQVVGSICYRPMFTGGASTTSPIFRMLDRYHGTLVLDEADFGRSDEAQDIMKILNTGYMKGVPVLRSVDKGLAGFDVEAYEVYGPKILGTRKRFQDKATESRCLTKEMGGGMPRYDIPIVLPREFWEQAREIRNLLLAYRMKNWEEEREVDYNSIDRSIEPRLNQVTMALKTIVEDPGLRGEIDAFIREYNRQLVVERSMTLASKVLEALVAIRRGAPFATGEGGEPFYDLSLKNVAKVVNGIIEGENRDEGGEVEGSKVEGSDKDNRRMVGPKRCGEIARNILQLRTERATAGQIKGNYFVVWDEERVKGLCARYGIENSRGAASGEGGSGSEGSAAPVLGTHGDVFREGREEWRQAGMGDGFEVEG